MIEIVITVEDCHSIKTYTVSVQHLSPVMFASLNSWLSLMKVSYKTARLGVLKLHSLYLVYYLGNELYVWYVEKYARELVISSSFKGRVILNSCS